MLLSSHPALTPISPSTSGSSVLVPAAPYIQAEYGISNREVLSLPTALYVLGLGVGPFVFAPVSELYGRQLAYASSMLGASRSQTPLMTFELRFDTQASPSLILHAASPQSEQTSLSSRL